MDELMVCAGNIWCAPPLSKIGGPMEGVCMCVCMCVCVCVVYLCAYVFVYCMRVCIQGREHSQKREECMCIYVCVCIWVCGQSGVVRVECVCMYMRVCVCTDCIWCVCPEKHKNPSTILFF